MATVTEDMATTTQLRLRSTITRLQHTATELWPRALQERPVLSCRRGLRPTQRHQWRPGTITTHPAIGVATGAGVPVGDGTITKRPRVRGRFSLCSSRGRAD